MAPRRTSGGPLGWAILAASAMHLAQAAIVSRAVALPASVKMLAVPDPGERISLSIALRLQNIDQLEDMLRAVSDPASPNYGEWKTAAEVREIFKPADDAAPSVTAWLSSMGITDVADQGTHINFATDVGTANQLLSASFAHFEVEGVDKVRTLQYAIPNELGQHIELISPTTFFGKTKVAPPLLSDEDLATLKPRQVPSNCARLIDPQCMGSMYNFAGYQADPASGSRVGFGSFLNQSARQEDLRLYLMRHSLPLSNFTTVLINGGEDHQDPRGDIGEANLDVQFMTAAVKTLPVTQFITGGSPPFVPNLRLPDEASNTNEPYLEYYQYLLTKENEEIPQVISHSYGDDEQTVPLDYARRVCNLAGMMGLRGVTLLESSGDSGVGAPCRANDGSNRVEFTPQFPGTCPYITVIGGTQAFNPEIAWVGSSGGFSNYFPTAWYQREAVQTYLDRHVSEETKAYYAPFANFSGRGFPDLSAHSLPPPYIFFISGAAAYTGGTSAAAPLVGGIIGLINDARLKAGKPTMGFLNPWLYAGGWRGLTDIVAGRGEGCQGIDLQTGMPVAGAGVIPYAYWNATEAWDPVTGWGVPDFQKMLALAMEIL